MGPIESTISGLFELGYGLCVAVYATFRHPIRGSRLLRARHRRRKMFGVGPYTFCYASVVAFFFVFYRTLLDPVLLKGDILERSPGRFIVFLLLVSAVAMGVLDIACRLAVAIGPRIAPTLQKLAVERAIFAVPFAMLSLALLGVVFDQFPVQHYRIFLPLPAVWLWAALFAALALLIAASTLSPFFLPWAAALFPARRNDQAATASTARRLSRALRTRLLPSLAVATVFILSVFGAVYLDTWLEPVREGQVSAFACDISDGVHLRVYMVVTLPPREGKDGSRKSGPYYLPKDGFKATLWSPISERESLGVPADIELVESSRGKGHEVTVLLPGTTNYLIFHSANLLAVGDFLTQHGKTPIGNYSCTIAPRNWEGTIVDSYGPWSGKRGRVVAPPRIEPRIKADLVEAFTKYPRALQITILEDQLGQVEPLREEFAAALKKIEEGLEIARKDGSDLTVLSEQARQARHRTNKIDAQVAVLKSALAQLKSAAN